ncbi:MAG: ABC transporter permease [Evtepia gabavorous]
MDRPAPAAGTGPVGGHRRGRLCGPLLFQPSQPALAGILDHAPQRHAGPSSVRHCPGGRVGSAAGRHAGHPGRPGPGALSPGQPGPDAPDDRPQRTAQAGSGAAVYHLVRDGPFLQGPDLGPDGLFIFAFNLYTGVQSVDPALVGAVRLLGGTQGQILGKVIWPACLPWLLTSLRTGLGLSLSGAIVGEYLGSTRGMGWLLSAAGDVFNAQRVLCCVLILVILIILLDGVVRLLEARLLRWR